ncbi:hypothetical protein PR003_g27861 [Phytophthora rubi]|uniref:Uncharacterized protein n=1 Tax=Phytophthora rubi TaxID=129364 RepID=A0A6A4C4A0_9STRA|nr:hypothetical protein PR003_g27861 [Phytophthora rubi]
MSMRDYVQMTRHLVSCIVTNPIDVASQVHVFIFGMREGMTRYCLTRTEPSTLEAAFAPALREDYTLGSPRPSPWRLAPSKPSRGCGRPRLHAVQGSTTTTAHATVVHWSATAVASPVIAQRCVARQLQSWQALKSSARQTTRSRPLFQKTVGTNSPPVLYAHFNATTTNGDSRLILISLHVAGAERPLRPLLDSGATNNFIRDGCLAPLPSHVRVREGPGEIVVKLADGKPHRAPRRAVSLAYAFDGFSTNDDFLVIELNYAFDCILGMPWLARYQPEINWLARSVRRRVGYDVISNPPSRAREGLKRNTVEQWLPYENYAVDQGLPHVKNAVEQRFPHAKNAVEQRPPLENATVEQRLPFADDSVAQQDLRDTGMVETELPCLEEVKRHPANSHPATLQPRAVARGD